MQKKSSTLERLEILQTLPAREEALIAKEKASGLRYSRRAFCMKHDLCEISLCKALSLKTIPHKTTLDQYQAAFAAEGV